MTSIRKLADDRASSGIKVAAACTLYAALLIGGGVFLFKATEPALAASEPAASVIPFRILQPRAMQRLTGLSETADEGEFPASDTASIPDLENNSCITERTDRKTGRHEDLDARTFCNLKHRLFDEQPIGRVALLEQASSPRFAMASFSKAAFIQP
ncbi:MAG: hypothetical protein DI528_05115 [Shinella sp.]|nr:MAG: hypothetical protein DI528_05115 [Shinella sp.]